MNNGSRIYSELEHVRKTYEMTTNTLSKSTVIHEENMIFFLKIEEILKEFLNENRNESIEIGIPPKISFKIEEILEQILIDSKIYTNSISTAHNNESDIQMYIKNVNINLSYLKELLSDWNNSSEFLDRNTKEEFKTFLNKYNTIENVIENIKRIESITFNESKKANKLIDNLQRKLNAFDSDILAEQTKRNNEFENYLIEKEKKFNIVAEELKENVSDEVKVEYKRIAEELYTKGDGILNEAKSTAEEIQEKLERVNLLIVAAGEKALNDGYKSYSKKASKARTFWQIVTLIPLLCIVFLAINSLYNTEGFLNFENAVSKIFYTMSLIGVASYCMRQAHISYIDEKRYKDMELKLGTIGAYLSDFEIGKQHDIKEKLVQDYFSVLTDENKKGKE